jgi:hypothetical protein
MTRRDPDGSRVAADINVDQAAVLGADAVLDFAVAWVEALGAFYDTDSVRRLLGRDSEPAGRQAVHKRKGLLALRTGSGRMVYPALQFRGRTLAPELDRVLDALPEDRVSRWTVASWLAAAEADLGGEAPIDVLFDADPAGVDAVVRVTRAGRKTSAADAAEPPPAQIAELSRFPTRRASVSLPSCTESTSTGTRLPAPSIPPGISPRCRPGSADSTCRARTVPAKATRPPEFSSIST